MYKAVWGAIARAISPYIREGSGLKPNAGTVWDFDLYISPYIREGSGLKLCIASSCRIA